MQPAFCVSHKLAMTSRNKGTKLRFFWLFKVVLTLANSFSEPKNLRRSGSAFNHSEQTAAAVLPSFTIGTTQGNGLAVGHWLPTTLTHPFWDWTCTSQDEMVFRKALRLVASATREPEQQRMHVWLSTKFKSGRRPENLGAWSP